MLVRERPPHILYLWHLCHMYGILTKVRQQLQGNCVADGTNAPSIDTSSCRKRKHTPSSTSVSDHGGLTKNMEQIVESINGLVGVTKQSHQTNTNEHSSLKTQRIRRHSPRIGQLMYGVGVDHVGRELPKKKESISENVR